jgi:hypothetical protein
MESVSVAVTLWTDILEALESNVGRDYGYSTESY